jgi:erythromycin esterase-like protein
VLADDGVPIEGALVVVQPPVFDPEQSPWGQMRLAHSDGQGRFRFSLKAGDYALSVTHPQWEGRAGIRFRIKDGRQANPLLALRLGPGTNCLEGHLRSASGRHPDGIVALTPIMGDPDALDRPIYCAEAEAGQYRVWLPGGTYSVAAQARGFGDFEGSVVLSCPTTLCNLAMPLPPSPAPRKVRRWIREHALALATCEPNGGFDDLEPLEAMVGPAKVVALGEACHGTREFAQLNQRILAFLVQRMGFTVIAVEATQPSAIALNEYILHGKGDPIQALGELSFWTGPTREDLELVIWLRGYNADPGHSRKVSLHGLDIASVQALGGGIAGHAAREKAMADHFGKVLSQAEPGAKAVILAHNGHVAKVPHQAWTGIPSMGQHLQTRLGKDYLVFGLAFRQGTFLALSKESAAKSVLAFELSPHPKGYLAAALASTGKPLLALDLRRIPAEGEIADWFRTPQGTWSIGAEFSAAEKEECLLKNVAAERYDVLLFVERISPPRPI